MDFFEVVHTQRSIRRFKADPVPEEALRQMIDAAIRAPSGSNEQPWAWLVVRDEGKRRAIADAVRAWLGASAIGQIRERAASAATAGERRMLEGAADFFEDVAAAPVLIVPCLYRVTSPTPDAHSLLAGSSIYGAVQNLMLAGRALGLGTVLTTFQAGIEDVLRRELGLPGDALPVAVVPVGWPAEGQRFGPTTRRPVDEVTFWDSWGSGPNGPLPRQV